MSPKFINKLQGKRVVIVGGTSGLGFATAEAAIEYGAIVVVASSKQENVDRAVDRIQKAYPEAGDRIRGKTVDLSSPSMEEQIVALLDFATDGGKHKLNHIVDTAGGQFQLSPLKEVTPEMLEGLYKVRLVGSAMLAKVAARYLDASAASSMTVTSGVVDSRPFGPGTAALAPVGAAKRGLARSLAVEMKPIRVNAVCPGAVKTELFTQFGDPERVEQMVELFKSKTLTNTIGAPEDLAECYISLMKNPFITGSEIFADGGYLLWS